MLVVKKLPAKAVYTRDMGSVPRLGRCPGRGNGNPLQYSCLENITKSPWISWLKQPSSSQKFLPHILVQLGWMSLPRDLTSDGHWSAIWDALSPEGFTEERSATKSFTWWLAGFSCSELLNWESQVLTGYWLKASLRSLSSGPFHWMAPKMAAGLPHSRVQNDLNHDICVF